MRILNEQELLSIWEDGYNRSGTERALLLLSIAFDITDTDKVANWSIGYRDSRLFLVRAQLFGNGFINHASCPDCNEKMEWELDISDFPLQDHPTDEKELYKFTHSCYAIHFRMPSSLDITRLNAEAILLACVQSVEKNGAPVQTTLLPIETLQALGDKMNELEPMANVSFSLSCIACDHQWIAQFDIISYLWTEIDNWAKHLLQEIILLAKAFGWSETEILRLGSRRRQLYLQLLQS